MDSSEICDKCFGGRNVKPWGTVQLCGKCKFELDRMVNWLTKMGVKLVWGQTGEVVDPDAQPPTIHTAREATEKAPESHVGKRK